MTSDRSIQTIKKLIENESESNMVIGEITYVDTVSGTISLAVRGSGIPLTKVPVITSAYVPGLKVGQNAIVAKIDNRYICLGAFGQKNWAANQWGAGEDLILQKSTDGVWEAVPATPLISTYGDYDTSAQSTANVDWTATTVSVSVTLVSAGWIEIVSSFLIKHTYAGFPGYCAAFVDTTEVGEEVASVGTSYSPPKSSCGSIYVAAGTYTVALKFISPTASKQVSIDDAYMTVKTWAA